MKIVKGIAGILSGLGFLFTLGSIGTIEFGLESGAVLSPQDELTAFIKAGFGMLVFVGSLIFIGLVEEYEQWKQEADISAEKRYMRRNER